MFIILLSISIIIILWTIKLLSIQVFSPMRNTEDMSLVQYSVKQRASTIELDDGRADIYDRNGNSLTGETIQALVILPSERPTLEQQAKHQALASILEISQEGWNHYILNLVEPQIWNGLNSDLSNHNPIPLSHIQIKSINALEIKGIYIVPYKARYMKPNLASHLIGFVAQDPERLKKQYPHLLHTGALSIDRHLGGAGLEKTFDRSLQGISNTNFLLFKDGRNRKLKGIGTRVVHHQNPYYPLKLITTIDKSIQEEIEAILLRHQVKQGAIVVLDTENADIISMVSRPEFDPYDIDMISGTWGNKALKAEAPGSIFKTVVAAAALEYHLVKPREYFQCDGDLGKYKLKCWKEAGHGPITMEQAYAESCNVAFAKVIERISTEQLEVTAHKLGLIQQVGYNGQLDSEEIGKIFDSETQKQDKGVRAQTAIGQRDVMVTPLQAANMVITLLHNGEVKSPRAVKEIRYQNDRLHTIMKEKEVKYSKKRISKRTARTLLHWMEHTVEDGTGQLLKDAKWSLAGKSGTAQASLNGKSIENHWFIGFGPVEKPKYAVAVLVQETEQQTMTSANTQKATKVFHDIMNALAD